MLGDVRIFGGGLGRGCRGIRGDGGGIRGGERVVMRILDQAAVGLELSDLGLDEALTGIGQGELQNRHWRVS